MVTKKSYLQITVLTCTSLFIVGCFLSPEDANNDDTNPTLLEMYAEIGKELEEPDAIKKEDQNKEYLKSQIGVYFRNREAAAYIDSCGLIEKTGNVYLYYEIVTDKPYELDSGRKFTGRGEIAFKYPYAGVTLATLNPALITDIISWYGIGWEKYDWLPGFLDSVEASVEFTDTDVTTIKPGLSRFWAKNISTSIALGQGDTGYYALDSLDDVNHLQCGEGRFYDAHGGVNNDEESFTFNFDVQLIHKNTLDPTKPYYRYKDNEGITEFFLPYWGTTDSLFFHIHYYPLYYRTGEIRLNENDGELLVTFSWDVKADTGTVIIHKEE